MGAWVPMACPLCPGVSLQVPAPGRAATRWGRAPLATANAAAATPAAAAHAGGGIRHPFSSAARHLMPRATRRRGHRSTRNVRPGRAGRCPHAVASHHFGQPGGRAQARARHAGRGGGVGPLRASPPTRMVSPKGRSPAGLYSLSRVSPWVLSLPEAQPASGGGGELPTARKAWATAVAALRGQVRHLVSPPRATGHSRRRSMPTVWPAARRQPASSPATISAGLALQRAAAACTRLEAHFGRHRSRGLVMASDSGQAHGPASHPTLRKTEILKFPSRSLGDAGCAEGPSFTRVDRVPCANPNSCIWACQDEFARPSSADAGPGNHAPRATNSRLVMLRE